MRARRDLQLKRIHFFNFVECPTNKKSHGEGKRHHEFAEWHNYAKCYIVELLKAIN